MSSIKATQIDGDVSVGRNIAVGGKATVQGSTQIKGNLKVEGWLDAKNIKGANKGIFTTIKKLREAYPLPHDGWWAIVGRTLPGPIYIGDGGEWVATGEEGGNPTIDSEQYNEAVAELQRDMSLMQQNIQNIEDKNNAQDTQLTSQGNNINSIQAQTNSVEATANEAKDKANAVGDELTELKNTKGAADGLAPLDSDRKIPANYLPSFVDDVIEFEKAVENIVIQQSQSELYSTDPQCSVVYSKEYNVFLLAHTVTEDNNEEVVTYYYPSWSDSNIWGTATNNGVIPESGKVYVDKSKNITYRWSGHTLVSIGSDLALGYTDSTAFPGSDGKLLQDEMETAKNEISNLNTKQAIAAQQIISRSIVNVNELLGLKDRKISFAVALDRIANLSGAEVIMIPGVVLTFLSDNGWQSKQWTNTTDWTTESNWTDFGTNGESIGNTINVNSLCDNIEYSLGTAIQAVQELERESGLSYFKSGVVLTFKTSDIDSNGAPIWLAYQFTREVSDIR